VTPHEGVAFFNRGKGLVGRKVKEEQLCSYDSIITDKNKLLSFAKQTGKTYFQVVIIAAIFTT
jgi:hypothetical protein